MGTQDANPAGRKGLPDLQGRIALVTGASRGIGRAIARRLAACGALVGVHYGHSPDAARAVVRDIEREGGEAFAVAADLAASDGVDRLLQAMDDALASRRGSPAFDILVNNAGVYHRGTIEAITPEQFDQTLQVNLRTPFFLIQKSLSRLRDGGRIINVSSMGTRAAYPAMAAYAPFKAALESLTVLLAAHLGPRRITVNAVLPGLTVTDMNPVDPATPAGAQAISSIALGRLGQPDDIASVVAFLASDLAGWVTAQRIEVSGGQRL